MAKHSKSLSFRLLLTVTGLNYLAQIPYFLHNYYYPHNLAPGVRAVGLLSFTLVWFIVGYICYRKRIKNGYAILLSFLIVQGLFYATSILSGAFIIQLRNQSNLIKAVFMVGYISGITSIYYAYRLIAARRVLKVDS